MTEFDQLCFSNISHLRLQLTSGSTAPGANGPLTSPGPASTRQVGKGCRKMCEWVWQGLNKTSCQLTWWLNLSHSIKSGWTAHRATPRQHKRRPEQSLQETRRCLPDPYLRDLCVPFGPASFDRSEDKPLYERAKLNLWSPSSAYCLLQLANDFNQRWEASEGLFPEENQNKAQQHWHRGGKKKPMQGWCGINEANERKKEREKERRCLLFASRLWRRADCIPRGAAIWWELATWSVSLTPDDNT